jgi:transposase
LVETRETREGSRCRWVCQELTTVKGALVSRIVIRLERRVKLKLREMRRQTRDKGLAVRCQIVLLTGKGRGRADVAESVGCSVSWVNRVVARWRDLGVAGLLDRREDNGELKLTEWFLDKLYEAVDLSPQDFGYPRPTWTRELLASVLFNETGVGTHPATIGRGLKKIGARLGVPRPTVGCPWGRRRKNRRLAEIRQVLASLGPDEAAVYLDEVDVHLNPKIGLDWMNKGKQKEVMTPGKNEKRYVCGAMDAKTRVLTWVRGGSKNSLLFAATLRKLAEQAYPDKRVIHVVLDNYRIHSSKISQAAVEALGGRVVLHFLPPYCPDDNRIERLWRDLHANVTRNHKCRTMDELMRQVTRYLMARNRRKRAQARKAAKAPKAPAPAAGDEKANKA